MVSVTMTQFNDTPGIGDMVDEEYLASFEGCTSEDEVNAIDSVSGATFTSASAKEAVIQALNASK